MCAVSLKHLGREGREASVYLRVPNSDAARRRKEFEQFATALRVVEVNVAKGATPATYVCYGIVILKSDIAAVPNRVGTPMRKFLANSAVDSPSANDPLAIFGTSITLRQTRMAVVAACPSGSLAESGNIGFVANFDTH
jgi:hypothetical protein